MGLCYVFLVASRLIFDAHGGRNGPAMVLLVKGSLVTTFGIYLGTGAETRTTSFQVSDPCRERCPGKPVS